MQNHIIMRTRALRHFFLAITTALLLSGCQTMGTKDPIQSKAPSELSGPAATAIADDLVNKFAEKIGPAKGTITLEPDKSPYGLALETALKDRGYAVSINPKDKEPNQIPLAYVLIPIDGQILARLSTKTLELGRIYAPNEAGADPVSPVSLMQRGG